MQGHVKSFSLWLLMKSKQKTLIMGLGSYLQHDYDAVELILGKCNNKHTELLLNL